MPDEKKKEPKVELQDLETQAEVHAGGSLVIQSDDIDEVESSSRAYNNDR